MAVAVYSPQDIYITIAGLYTVTGYADGTFVKISKDLAPFSTTRGMDGEQSRMYQQDLGFTVEITLAQSSSTNNVFQSLYNIDIATQMGKVALYIKDSKGDTTFIATSAWIEQLPDVVFSNNMETRTWRFQCAGCQLSVGGNGDTSTLSTLLTAGSSALGLLSSFGLV